MGRPASKEPEQPQAEPRREFWGQAQEAGVPLGELRGCGRHLVFAILALGSKLSFFFFLIIIKYT